MFKVALQWVQTREIMVRVAIYAFRFAIEMQRLHVPRLQSQIANLKSQMFLTVSRDNKIPKATALLNRATPHVIRSTEAAGLTSTHKLIRRSRRGVYKELPWRRGI